MGVSCYRQTGLESDDLLAQAALQIHTKEDGVIITSDGDLFQMISHAVHWYNPHQNIYLTPTSFLKKKGIDPWVWGRVKSIAGCSTDCVDGVPRVGEKTAARYLNGDLPKTHKTYKAIESEEGIRIANRNKELVCLPHPKTKVLELREPQWNAKGFFDLCERYGFVSFLRKKQAWKRLFRGRFQRARKRRK